MLSLVRSNPRVTFRIRRRVVHEDARMLPWHHDGVRDCIIRKQSTHVQTSIPKSQPCASAVDVAKEEKVCVSKHLHISNFMELPQAPVSSSSAHKITHDEKHNENSLKVNNEITCEKKRTYFASHVHDSLTFHPDIMEDVRWNRGLTHTYDDSFILTDIVSHSFRINKERLSYPVQNDLVLQSSTPKVPEPESESMLFGNGKECAADISQFSTVDPPSKIKTEYEKKKVKSVSTKKKNKPTTVHHNEEKSSKMISSTVEARKLVTKSKQKWSSLEMIGVESFEEENGVQQPSQVISHKPIVGVKVKKGSKKHKKLKKDEENTHLREVRRRGREASFNQSLAAYISVCINLGMLNRATHTLLYYRQCARHSSRKDECQKVSTIQPYNSVLQGHAEKGNYKKVKELLKCLQEDGIKPNESTFVLVLSCLGRQEGSAGNTDSIRMCIETLQKEGIDLQDALSRAGLQDTRDFALKAVTRVNPSFELQQMKAPHEYWCPLVNKLNKTMNSTKVSSPAHGVVTEAQLNKWLEEQIAMEIKSELVINSIEKKPESLDTQHYRKLLDKWEENWRNVLHQAFITQMGVLRKSFFGNRLDKRMNIYPYLVSLPPEEFINIMMQEIQRLARGSENFSFTKYMMFRHLGELVYARYLVKYKKEVGVLDKLKTVYKDYISWYLDNGKKDSVTYNPRVKWQELAYLHSSGPSLEHNPVEWPNTVMVSIGKFMYSLILLKVMLWNPLNSEKHVYPAIYEVERTKGYRVVDEIRPSPSLVELYTRAAKPTLTFESVVSPMLCPPLPWVSTNLGGYLLNNTKFVRLPYNAYQQKQRMEECGKQQLYPIMDSLNQLGSIPWRVNEPMLDIINQLFNECGCEELDIPQPPSKCPEPHKVEPGMSSAEIFKIRNQRLEYEQRKNEMHSLWCDALYKLSLAQHFRNRVFWFPHNMDFRGRVYPCPPHLNHLSSDVFRSILQFARGEKLGPDGLRWLKLHLINLTGLVKREAVEDRIRYCEEIMPEILDSADHPLTGRRWWTKSDEPWQTLAACKELAAAVQSGNPEEYTSHLPIHQDGSCNGLQHYAALGRDKIGAVSVNLAPSREPQDVYSDVAALVEKERQKDASAGHKIAKVLEGHVKRKVIKQTVMTTVYGVTRYGARLQIEKQLKALDDFPKEQRWAASHYLVHKTFFCLEKMFTSTKEIQNWFTDCAKIVSEIRGENLEYVTPLGLPVVQPYSKFIGDQASVGKLPATFCMDSFMKPNVMKQKNAFPPNFIHSLDSTHMMLTSLHCQQAGITFVSVHDCFWTHACSVNTMNKICRDQFVALHNEPILEDLSRFLQKKFSLPNCEFAFDGSALDSSKMKLNNIVRRVPPKGEFDINNVLSSVYFFS